MHPDLTELILYVEGETLPARRSAIREHLNACPECCHEVCRLNAAFFASDPPDANIFDSILGAVRRTAPPAVVKGRVAGVVQPFLGNRATETILSDVSHGGDNLLSSIEPIMALFLGARAASSLITNAVDRAVTTS